MFKEKFPVAWAYQKNTERTSTTLLSMDDKKIPEPAFKEYPGNAVTELPAPLVIKQSFSGVLNERKSCRNFSRDPLNIEILSTILYYGYGIKNKLYFNNTEFLERHVPSGGRLYSLELYLIIRNVSQVKPGIYHYFPLNHSLELISEINLPSYFISHLFLDQPYVASAGAHIIACSMQNRCMQKYEDRGYRYILFEAGHVFQNMNLCAAALNTGALNLGGFYDGDVLNLLGIKDDSEVPLYGMALGAFDAGDIENVRGMY
ncbi:MAG: SagB/ThcOx family dehydrogenase [Ginsengibacter sp.]